MKYSKYLVRPEDYAIFVLVDENKGLYSIKNSVDRFPNNFHQKYENDKIRKLGWYAVSEDYLPTIQKKQTESWQKNLDNKK